MLVYFADEIGEDAFRRGRAIAAALDRRPPPGLREFVPSFTSVLLEFSPGAIFDGSHIVAALGESLNERVPPAPVKVIAVKYDGPDLELVAEHAGMSPREAAQLHATGKYRVYALGFAPGFPYLGDLDPRLHTPRLATPRPKVPAGSVAIGGQHTGIYPFTGPGGWNLIGRTESVLFDPQRSAADRFLLRPGDLVRFQPVP
jgi:KipI family sensor histidine kinase inhibitor